MRGGNTLKMAIKESGIACQRMKLARTSRIFDKNLPIRIKSLDTPIKRKSNLFIWILMFYVDGFQKMTLGKTLWKIIFTKLIIMFAVLKVFFFQDFLASRFATDGERAQYVLEQLTQPVQPQNTVLEAEE